LNFLKVPIEYCAAAKELVHDCCIETALEDYNKWMWNTTTDLKKTKSYKSDVEQYLSVEIFKLFWHKQADNKHLFQR
jgi:hypothetical protein